jgi:hypothetical protein
VTDLFQWAAEQAKPTAEQAADEAIARVGSNADPGWVRSALDAVRSIALTRSRFTTDDVWELLERRGVQATHEPRALGAVIRMASKKGIIRSTGEYVKSKRVECHSRPVMVWEAI